jgi:hypothetical protein
MGKLVRPAGLASSRGNITLPLHQAPLADFANFLFAIAS